MRDFLISRYLFAFVAIIVAAVGVFGQRATPSVGCAPLEVSFTPPVSGPAFWDFGDGVTSTLTSPSHVYTVPGTYTAELRAAAGGSLLGTTTVEVFAQPTIDLTVDPTRGCAPQITDFTAEVDLDDDIVVQSVRYAFGDGNTGAGPTARHVYQSAGAYDVSVELTTNIATCNVTSVFPEAVRVANGPSVTLVTNPAPPQSCDVPLFVTASARVDGVQPYTYKWNFGNGDTSDLANPPGIAYTEAGGYTIRLEVTDGTGCSTVVNTPVSVGGPVADFDLPDTVCIGVAYEVNALGAATSYAWTYGPGITVLADEGFRQNIVFNQAGLVTVGLAVVNGPGGCAADTTRQIFVQSPLVDAVSEPSYSCDNPFTIDYSVRNVGVDVEWSFPYGSSDTSGSFTPGSSDTSVTYTYDDGGEFGQNWLEIVGAEVQITTAQGCVASTTLRDTIDVPNALFVPDVHEGCAPLLVTFGDSIRTTRDVSEVVIDWGDGQTEVVSSQGPWQHTYTSPGEFAASLSVLTAGGCRDSSYAVLIEVGETLAEPVFAADVSSLCFGDTLTFTSAVTDPRVDAIHFDVEGGSSHHCPSDDVLRHVLSQPVEGNTLDVTFSTVYNGCLTSAEASYPYNPAALARLDYLIECETPFDVRFFAQSTNADYDSLFVVGITDTAYVTRLLVVDSVDLTLPARGTYLAVLQSDNATSTCGPTTDTLEFFVTEPEANFEIDSLLCSGTMLNLNGSNSQDVNATCSKGYQWDFSFRRPYVTSDEVVTEVSGNATGRHTVSLIVDDINGCRDTLTRDIRLFSTQLTPVADDMRICLPGEVKLTLGVESDTTITEYMWDFAGQGTSEDQNPSFTFASATPGEPLVVTVMTTDALDCPGEATLNIEVYEPTSTITADPSTGQICAGDAITLSASDFTEEGSSLTYAWDFDNGTTGSAQTETVGYANAGEYTVELDFVEQGSGCQGSTTFPVSVQEPPTLAFTSDVDGQEVVCFPQIITFTNTSPAQAPFTPIWLGGPSPFSGNVYAAGLERGTTSVSLVGVTSAGCADTLTRDFTLTGPEASIAADRTSICPGESITYSLQDTTDVESWTWDFGNGVTEDNTDPATATYDVEPPSGSTLVSLTVASASNECTFTDTLRITFDGITAGFITDDGGLAACDDSVDFINQSQGATRFSYSFGADGALGTSSEPSPTQEFPGPGAYEVTLAVANDAGTCRDTVTEVITVLEPLDLLLEPVSACFGEQVEIPVEATREIVFFQLTPADLVAGQSTNSITTVPLTEQQTVTVTAIDSVGCEATAELSIEVGEAFPGQGDTLTVLAGSEVTLPVTNPGGYTFNWLDPQPGCADCENPTVRVEQTTLYRLQIEDSNGCTSQILNFLVIVAPAPVVPNLFSPDGDGTNDDWGPLFPEGARPTVEQYQVFSRWGTLVFEGDSPEARWDGDNQGNGETLPSDTYAYVIRFVYPNNEVFEAAGEVTLLR